jgi:para-nitrobenzyl esterase
MPRARGLFHKAILQSGSLNLTRSPEAALASTRMMLSELGVAPERAHTLRDVPAASLVAAMNAIAGRTVVPPFSPVADGDLTMELGEHPALREAPQEPERAFWEGVTAR